MKSLKARIALLVGLGVVGVTTSGCFDTFTTAATAVSAL